MLHNGQHVPSANCRCIKLVAAAYQIFCVSGRNGILNADKSPGNFFPSMSSDMMSEENVILQASSDAQNQNSYSPDDDLADCVLNLPERLDDGGQLPFGPRFLGIRNPFIVGLSFRSNGLQLVGATFLPLLGNFRRIHPDVDVSWMKFWMKN